MTNLQRVTTLLATGSLMLVGAGCTQTGAVPTTAVPTPTATTAPAPTTTAPAAAQNKAKTPPVVTPPSVKAPTAKPAPTPTPVKKPTTINQVAPHRTQVITMTKMEFSPKVLAVAVGDTVVWSNKDTVNHTTVSDNALIWDSGNLKPGASYSRVFNAPGTYTYHCAAHPSMTGSVIVYTVTK
jgi:plastocyanin